jgi:hypothetical protein
LKINKDIKVRSKLLLYICLFSFSRKENNKTIAYFSKSLLYSIPLNKLGGGDKLGCMKLLSAHLRTCLGSGLASCILSELEVVSLFNKLSLFKIQLKQKKFLLIPTCII